jgi:hypothetical protein
MWWKDATEGMVTPITLNQWRAVCWHRSGNKTSFLPKNAACSALLLSVCLLCLGRSMGLLLGQLPGGMGHLFRDHST